MLKILTLKIICAFNYTEILTLSQIQCKTSCKYFLFFVLGKKKIKIIKTEPKQNHHNQQQQQQHKKRIPRPDSVMVKNRE